MQEREIGNIQRKDKRISLQRSKRGSPHQRRGPSGRGKGLDHDTKGSISSSARLIPGVLWAVTNHVSFLTTTLTSDFADIEAIASSLTSWCR